VLEHLSDPRRTLREIGRILKPGGRLIVAVPNYSSVQARWSGPAWFHLDLPRHLFHFPVAGLRRLLVDSGFTLRSEHHFSLRQNPFGWVQSALNRLGRLPRNGLYTLLKSRPGAAPAYGLPARVVFRLAYWMGMPIACGLSVAEALARSGASVCIVSERRCD
jgi:SAM-dependent methyltransferase